MAEPSEWACEQAIETGGDLYLIATALDTARFAGAFESPQEAHAMYRRGFLDCQKQALEACDKAREEDPLPPLDALYDGNRFDLAREAIEKLTPE